MSIQVGLYRHFKGNPYRVMGFVRHSETMESMVLYQALYGDFALWIRPTAMFAETVEVDGRTVPRFAYEGTRDPMFHPPEDQA